MGLNLGSGWNCPRLRWDPWARHRTPECSPNTAVSAAHCSRCGWVCVCVCVCPLLQVCVCVCVCPLLRVCALGWVKCREHISLLVILCIIVYVTNKAHLSLIIIIEFFRKQKWVCSQEIQVRDGRKERDNRKDVEAFRSICGMNKGWEEQHLDAEDKTSRHNFVSTLISENSDI